MPSHLIENYTDTKAVANVERSLQPIERDVELTAHVQQAFADMEALVEQEHGASNVNYDVLFAYLPDPGKVPPMSQTNQQITWDIPGNIHHDDTYDVNFHLVSELAEHIDTIASPDSEDTDAAIGRLRQSIMGYTNSLRWITNDQVEPQAREEMRGFAKIILAQLKKYQQLAVDDQKERYETSAKAIEELVNSSGDIAASEILTALAAYSGVEILDKDLGVLSSAGDRYDASWHRRNIIGNLAQLERLRAMHRAKNIVGETTKFIVTAEITDGNNEVGSIQAIFGNTGPYSNKLRALQNNPDVIRSIIHKARSDAYAKLHGGYTGIKALSEDELAAEVDDYEGMHELVVACIKEQMGDVAADFDALPPDSNTEALSNQEQLLELARDTNFGNLKEPFQGAWRGDMLNVLGIKAPF